MRNEHVVGDYEVVGGGWLCILQVEKATAPCETTVVSIAEGLSDREVDPRKEARVAEPLLSILAVGEERTVSMIEEPAGLGRVQWLQWGCLALMSPPMT